MVNEILDNFLNKNQEEKKEEEPKKEETKTVCDIKTGECYTIPSKDGLIERVDKTFITKDGKFLLND